MEGRIPVSARPRTSLTRAKILFRACAAVWITLTFATLALAQDKPSESDVKAAYLFNFARFVRFAPGSEPHGSFDICILGRDSIGHTLDQITSGEAIDKRAVRVLRVSDPTDGRHCTVLFISAFEGDALREDMAILAGADALTVSDAPDFIQRGGMIQFVMEGDHVRFAVNLDAVNHTHLSLSSELLRVAASVKGSPASGGRR
jgi:YfiR/HmsC-like